MEARRSLIFARLLRAVVIRQLNGYQLEELLDVSDVRTLSGLMKLAGLSHGAHPELPKSVDEFLEKQQLITNNTALRVLRGLLATRGFSNSR